MLDEPHGGGAAPYATKPHRSRGRLHAEPESATRSAFQRDRDRIIHSTAFRRLMYKTQVFVHHEGDHYRTRLTHSLEVAQIARSVARELGLDEDLTEALALAHDLGHTPFGHAGEAALDTAMGTFGGFDHNAQALRIVTKLEARYADFDGLNLTWETLEGLVKHNGPLGGGDERPLPAAIVEYVAGHDLELASHPGAEAQVAALADDIAYNNHDIDDGLRAGMFTIDDLADVPLAGPIFASVRHAHPGIAEPRLIHESVRRMIGSMVDDLIAETRRRAAEWAPGSVEDVRALGRPLAAFSDAMRDNDRGLKAFLGEHMYRHHRRMHNTGEAQRILHALFDALLAEPARLPESWRARIDSADATRTARLIADYIAGMTDRYAVAEYERLFNCPPSLQ